MGILLLFGALIAIAWGIQNAFDDDEKQRRGTVLLLGGAELLARTLPRPEATRSEMSAAMQELAAWFNADVALWDRNKELLASSGGVALPPGKERIDGGWVHRSRVGPGVVLKLPDGRWVTGVDPIGRTHRFIWGLAFLALLALAVGIGAYPVVRRLTRRLERLHTQVDALASGELSARVEVEGNDEIATVARSFNRAAARIEQLVSSQRDILASASHELRSPLTRIRMASELLGRDERPELQANIARDVAELDELIEELLLASKLNSVDTLDLREEIDVLGLAAEEGARVGSEVSGVSLIVQGDRRLLRRAIRNLFENARRYGEGSRIVAEVTRDGAGGGVLAVENGGRPIPPAQRERVFEPFYRPPGTSQGSEGGVGLGLALVRQIARRHGGDVRWAEPERATTRIELMLRIDPRNPPSG